MEYADKVELVINKYARNSTEDSRDDLRQSCYLALLDAGSRVNSPAIAYLICRDVVFREIKKEIKEQSTVSLSEPAAQFEAENKAEKVEFDGLNLDVHLLDEALGKIGWTERTVIAHRYGLQGLVQHSLAATAFEMGESVAWVREREKTGMEKLKHLLGYNPGWGRVEGLK